MNVALESFAAKLKYLREAKGLTKYRLAKLSGIPEAYVGQLESGKVDQPRRATLNLLAKGLGESPSIFFDMSNDFSSAIKSRPFNELVREVQERYNALELIELPIIGTIPGSYPLSIDNPVGSVSIIKELLGGEVPVGSLYALQIKDDSLQNLGIYEGDIAVIDSSSKDIAEGNIYAIRLGDEVCIKLIGRDPKLNDAEILGRVILTGRWNKH